jgi:hypothetical protein
MLAREGSTRVGVCTLDGCVMSVHEEAKEVLEGSRGSTAGIAGLVRRLRHSIPTDVKDSLEMQSVGRICTAQGKEGVNLAERS